MPDADAETNALGTALTANTPFGTLDQQTRPVALEARLVCVAGADMGASFRIGIAGCVIGRGEVDVRLATTDISRRHAKISADHDGFTIEDLGSSNGTFVNAMRIAATTRLQYSDRIQIGTTIFVFTRHDELEVRMNQLQKLESMATVVSGLAHDFNNALTVILGGVNLLDEDLPEDARGLREVVADMRHASDAAMGLAKRLMNLGRSGPVPLQAVPLLPLVEDTVGMIRRVANRLLSIVVEISPGAAVRGSREELQQVLMNLCINARDAMPNGGTLTIATRDLSYDWPAAMANHLPAAGDYVELHVVDTGIGMDEATLARAFEPFFTTKAPGHGTGLGLAMTHMIVRRHGGAVLVESRFGHGTTFRIVLPKPPA